MFSDVQICGLQRQQAKLKLRGGNPFMFSSISLSVNKLVANISLWTVWYNALKTGKISLSYNLLLESDTDSNKEIGLLWSKEFHILVPQHVSFVMSTRVTTRKDFFPLTFPKITIFNRCPLIFNNPCWLK